MSAEHAIRRIVVTGANRGLGLEFTRQWLESGQTVHALAREPDRSAGLLELMDKYPERVFAHACDVADEASVQAASAAIARQTSAIDVLVNNAGIHDRASPRLDSLDWAQQHRVYEVNALGPLRVARALLPLLRGGSAPRIVNMTSLMGSIADNASGGAYGYRMSKAALNMATRNMAHELGPEGIVCSARRWKWQTRSPR
jgi:NAD(P)-dependent dehydrogenase (short-subunit alcohol dehydrogenase family)